MNGVTVRYLVITFIIRQFLFEGTQLMKQQQFERTSFCVFCDRHQSARLCTNTQGADKSLARPTSRCILYDGENISFDASLVVYINNTNIPPIIIINRIYETQNLLSL